MNNFSKTSRLLAKNLFYAAWAAVVILGVYYTLRGIDRTLIPSGLLSAMGIHIAVGAVALIVGPLQFFTVIRRRWPRFHRTIGWIYVGCVLIATPMIFRVSYTGSCTECIPPFYIWNALWLITTGIAVWMAINRRFEIHRQFMIRSYVLMNGFVFTRIDEFMPFPLPEGPDVNRPAMIIWLVWVIPLLITEFWLSWLPAIRGRNTPRD